MMARYDRIARLPTPTREDAFPCWAAVGDLEGRERDPALGRRALVRFLALRPLDRRLRHAHSPPDAASLSQQVAAADREMGPLPTDDPERLLLEDLLDGIPAAPFHELAAPALAVAERIEACGQHRAAEEFHRAAAGLARTHNPAGEVRGLLGAARARAGLGDTATAHALCQEAAAVAEHARDLDAWGVALVTRAGLTRDAGVARALLDDIVRNGESADAPNLRGIGAAGICLLLLGHRPDGFPAVRPAPPRDMAGGLEAGLAALHLSSPDAPHRIPTLLAMGLALLECDLAEAADACLVAVLSRRTEPRPRPDQQARAEAARVLATVSGGAPLPDAGEYRLPLLDGPDPLLTGHLHLELGHVALRAGGTDRAREHLRDALAVARDSALDSVLLQADSLLDALERAADHAARSVALTRTEPVVRIADHTLQLLEREAVNAR
ncbi:MAG TPA: hypothetical protein VK966_05400 [Longimicrobiales bacterium]|nr:hypothetical protein [Longimicrobiales bacterium]